MVVYKIHPFFLKMGNQVITILKERGFDLSVSDEEARVFFALCFIVSVAKEEFKSGLYIGQEDHFQDELGMGGDHPKIMATILSDNKEELDKTFKNWKGSYLWGGNVTEIQRIAADYIKTGIGKPNSKIKLSDNSGEPLMVHAISGYSFPAEAFLSTYYDSINRFDVRLLL